MLTHEFVLDSGRRTRLESIEITNSMAGVLEGHPKFLREAILKDTPKRLSRVYGDSVLLVTPPGEILPTYRFVVSLSSRPLPSQQPRDDYSFMAVCWFQDELNGNVLDLVGRVIKRIPWDEYARNCTVG